MTCTKAQVILLLEKIRDELKCEEDKELLDEYIERIKSVAWSEIVREFY